MSLDIKDSVDAYNKMCGVDIPQLKLDKVWHTVSCHPFNSTASRFSGSGVVYCVNIKYVPNSDVIICDENDAHIEYDTAVICNITQKLFNSNQMIRDALKKQYYYISVDVRFDADTGAIILSRFYDSPEDIRQMKSSFVSSVEYIMNIVNKMISDTNANFATYQQAIADSYRED